MIVKAREGTGGPALARYLTGEKNEHAELLEVRNLHAVSAEQAIFLMDALARGAKCKEPVLHVQMRAAPGERLSADHWREAADRYAEAFGLHEHQAFIVLHHQPDGCTHCHAVFNRVHPETMIAADLWRNYPKHKELSRQMEIDWGLRRVSSRQRASQHRDYSNAGRPETEQARRAGRDVHALRDRIRQAWERSDDALSFGVALGEAGFTLAKGDRRDFVAVDDKGHVYSIGQRTTGASAAAVRERMAGLGAVDVPTLAEVREGQEQERQRRREGRAGEFNEAAQKHYGKPPKQAERYFLSSEARRADWERAAAARIERMRQRHAREFEKQQRGFEQAAPLERGAAVQDFNHTQRHDLTQDLLKKQAEELAAEHQRQQGRRADWDWRERCRAELRRALEENRRPQRKRRRGGFKQFLREELTRQRQQPAHIGATYDNRAQPPDGRRPDPDIEAREREAERQRRAAHEQAPRQTVGLHRSRGGRRLRRD